MVMGLGKTKTQKLRDRASGLVDSLAPHVETARDRAVLVSADVAAKTGPALSDARDRTLDALGGARGKAGPVLAGARERATPVLADARDKAAPVVAPYVASVKDRTGPVVADVRERSAPVVDRIAHELIPAFSSVFGAVGEATEDARSDVAERTSTLASAVQEQVDPAPKKHPIRNSLISLLAGAATFAVVRRLADRNRATADWQTAYTPPPAPATSPTVDTAAAGPGEAVADATDVPHGTTTPDNPVIDIDVDKR